MTEVSRTVSALFGRRFKLTIRGLGSSCLVVGLSSAAFGQVQGPVVPHHHGVGANGVSTDAQTVSQQPSATGKPAATIPAATAADPVPTEAVSQLQQPPKQAVIESQANTLTIRADNSSLTQTLQRIADQTGMHLEGISGDQRVFGNFGPGTPRDVLSTLLTGTGYNILMIGSLDNGAPRQLILTQKKADTLSGGGARPQQNTAAPDDDSGDQPQDDQSQQPQPPPMSATVPGVRTPQQMMQQMQQMRQQGDQQQANQPQ